MKVNKANWRTMHDYSSTNTNATCRKCGRTLKGKAAKFNDTEPVCTVKEGGLKTLLKTKHWYGLPPYSYFFQEYHPFHIKEVKMRELL